MNGDLRFVRTNKDKAVFDFRSEVNNHFAPNVTLLSSDNVKVKGHVIILASCPYFRELFKKDKTTNSHLVFHEKFPGDVIEFVVKYIYTGEYSLLDVEKLPEVLQATSKGKYNIPVLAKGYLLKQMDTPGGLNQSNWHLFYKNGIKLSLGENYFNSIFIFLKEKYGEFYKSEEFKYLTYEQICKLMKSPNRPFGSISAMTEASLFWTKEHAEVGIDKLTELSKICTNPIQTETQNSIAQNGVNSDINPILIAPTHPCLETPSTSTYQAHSSNSLTPHVTKKRTRTNTNSQEINVKRKKSNTNYTDRIKIYNPPKHQWNTASLLFFGRARKNEPEYLWSYSFQTGELKRMASIPMKNLKDMSLIVSKKRIFSIGGSVGVKSMKLLRSLPLEDLGENINKPWVEGPNLSSAKSFIPALEFRNSIIYLFGGTDRNEIYFTIEKWQLYGKKSWVDNEKHMLFYRERFGVALLNNIIYMIGGNGFALNDPQKKDDVLYTGEFYNIISKAQGTLPKLKQKRFDLRVVVLNERIYAIGGLIMESNQSQKLTSVESYKPGDPNWVQVAHMNQPRAAGSTFVLDEMIYVIGGNDGAPTMERYCPQEGTWTMVDANLPQWANFSSSVLFGPSNLTIT